MASADFQSSINYTASVETGNLAVIDNKRNLFGRKKKSATNLTGSPINTISTATSAALPAGDGVGSLSNIDANKNKKGVIAIFGRKGKVENTTGSSSIGSIEESREHQDGGSQGSQAGGEDNDSLISYDTDSDTNFQNKSSGYLRSTPTPTLPSSIPKGTKPLLFGRRSASPMALNRASTSPIQNPPESVGKENARTSVENRPSTSGGETARESEERSRPASRISISTSSTIDLPPAEPRKSNVGRKASLGIPKLKTSATPQITATPPTPTDGTAIFPAKSPVGAIVNIGQTRQRSRTNSVTNTPSKLSQSMTSPVTPPGTGEKKQSQISTQVGQDGKSGGFFQSMFSAAQTAATGLTNAIPMNLANNTTNRTKSSVSDSPDNAQVDRSVQIQTEMIDNKQPEREPAVKTLGQGELNLATLGIVPEAEPAMRTDTIFSSPDSKFGRDRAQGSSGALKATSGYSGFETAGESSLGAGLSAQEGQRQSRTPLAEDTPFMGSRGGSVAGDVTPDRNSIVAPDDRDDWDPYRKRSGSVRSGGGTSHKKRHRGSSAASGASVLQPIIPKSTGFAVASKKRNRDYHNLFKSVPEVDYLIEDYGCALQKEILLQGRFYVSEGHICFYSNILGWVTTLVISFDEVMSVEKKSTALLFPNAIVIQTLHARHIFASFITRDSTYDLIVGLWNVGHPQLVQGAGETHLDGSQRGELDEASGEDDDEYEDESDDDLGESFTDAGGDGALDDMGNATSSGSKVLSRKTSQMPVAAGGGDSKELGSGGTTSDFPGPATHLATVCGDDAQHYDKQLCDETLPAPLGKVYSLMFGVQSYSFLKRLLTEEEKVLELQILDNGEWKEEAGKKTRAYNYIKPLYASIGPKQTKCLITEVIDFCELEDHVTVTVSTQTPDVPSGGVFSVKTRYCLMWGENNTTRIICNCTVEWTGKSWIKGPIEKGANDGQIAYNKTLLTSLRTELAPKKAAKQGAKGKSKRKKDGETRGDVAREIVAEAKAAENAKQGDSWGMFEALKLFLGPAADIVKPLLPTNFTNIVLFVLFMWLVVGKLKGGDPTIGLVKNNHIRWNDAWQSEEEGLWEWLEERSGINGITFQETETRGSAFRKAYSQRATSEGMKDRQVRDAIVTMEQRLEFLKRMVEANDPQKVAEQANA